MSNNVGVDDPVDPNKQKYINKPMSKVPTSNIQKLTSNVAITLIALIITIIVLLILAGVTLNMVMGDSGIFSKANLAKERTAEAQEKEIKELGNYENKINEIVGTRENDALYQKLRSDTYIDVDISSDFVAPTDGYLSVAGMVENKTEYALFIITHCLSDGTIIQRFNAGGYLWSYDGDMIYMKKGEYVKFTKEANVKLDFAKFWYAEGSIPSK